MNVRTTAALAAFLAALALGYAWTHQPDPGHVVGGFTASQDPPTTCWFGAVRGDAKTLASLKITLPPKSTGILLAKSCFALPDGGTPPLPEGLEYSAADEWSRPYIEGEPVFEAWVSEHPSAPWRCACGASGALDAGACEAFVPSTAKRTALLPSALPDGAPVEIQEVVRLDGGVWEPVVEIDQWKFMERDAWRGNCTRMPCGSWSGVEPTPEACRASECLGRECGRGRAGGHCGPIPGYRNGAFTCAENRWQLECDPSWECGPGKWYVASCGTCASGVCDVKTHRCSK